MARLGQPSSAAFDRRTLRRDRVGQASHARLDPPESRSTDGPAEHSRGASAHRCRDREPRGGAMRSVGEVLIRRSEMRAASCGPYLIRSHDQATHWRLGVAAHDSLIWLPGDWRAAPGSSLSTSTVDPYDRGRHAGVANGKDRSSKAYRLGLLGRRQARRPLTADTSTVRPASSSTCTSSLWRDRFRDARSPPPRCSRSRGGP